MCQNVTIFYLQSWLYPYKHADWLHFSVFVSSGSPDSKGLECDVQHPGHPRHLGCLQGCGRLRPWPLQPGAGWRQRGTLQLPAVRRWGPVLPGEAARHPLPPHPGYRAGQHQPFRAGHPAVPPCGHSTCGPPGWWAEGQVLRPGLQPERDHGQVGRAAWSDSLKCGKLMSRGGEWLKKIEGRKEGISELFFLLHLCSAKLKVPFQTKRKVEVFASCYNWWCLGLSSKKGRSCQKSS